MAANEAHSLGEQLVAPVSNVSDFIWAGTLNGAEVLPFPPMTLILLGVGLWFMVGLRFYPILKLGSAFAGLFAARKGLGEGEISPFAALSTALSGQVGSGNLAGVATAIALGRPGAVFCLSTLFSALVTGNSIQANEVASGLNELFGWERWFGGLVVALAVFVVNIGGIKSIGNVAEKVVPFMAFAYVAIRAGVARGLFSNESGQGSAAMAHAVAQTDDPAQQGRMAMMGTFIDTIVICTMTALAVLSGVVFALARGDRTAGSDHTADTPEPPETY